MAIILGRKGGGAGGGGGGPPSGAAGGDLGGSYPNPTLSAAKEAELDAAAAAAAAAQTTANAAVPKALYDANTVLAANSDDTPAALTMGASTILARLAAGNIKAASVAEILTLLAVPTNAQAVLQALADAKGDLVAATAADTFARVAVGANGTALIAASGATPGVNWDFPPGYQYNRVAITTTATFTATSAATATTVLTAGAITPGAGVVVRVVVQSPGLGNSGANSTLLNVWRAIDGGAAVDLGILAQAPSTGSAVVCHGEYTDTPGAGSIVYTIRGWVSSASTGSLFATAPYTPSSVRIVRV